MCQWSCSIKEEREGGKKEERGEGGRRMGVLRTDCQSSTPSMARLLCSWVIAEDPNKPHVWPKNPIFLFKVYFIIQG